jgi:hypothetical protein
MLVMMVSPRYHGPCFFAFFAFHSGEGRMPPD